MITIDQAITFACEHGVTVGVDIQGYKGCVQTVKHFSVYKGEKIIRIEQAYRGSKTWKHSGDRFYSRGDAIVAAVTKITGVIYYQIN